MGLSHRIQCTEMSFNGNYRQNAGCDGENGVELGIGGVRLSVLDSVYRNMTTARIDHTFDLIIFK